MSDPCWAESECGRPCLLAGPRGAPAPCDPPYGPWVGCTEKRPTPLPLKEGDTISLRIRYGPASTVGTYRVIAVKPMGDTYAYDLEPAYP